jgi:predicted nuclease of predicted toxin-antitoxin system
MRILLDGCVPRTFRRALPDHAVQHVADLGWDDLDDGPLLDRATGVCDVFLTTDKSLPFQQRLRDRPFAVVVLRARSNRLPELLPLVEALRAALPALQPGELRVLGA